MRKLSIIAVIGMFFTLTSNNVANAQCNQQKITLADSSFETAGMVRLSDTLTVSVSKRVGIGTSGFTEYFTQINYNYPASNLVNSTLYESSLDGKVCIEKSGQFVFAGYTKRNNSVRVIKLNKVTNVKSVYEQDSSILISTIMFEKNFYMLTNSITENFVSITKLDLNLNVVWREDYTGYAAAIQLTSGGSKLFFLAIEDNYFTSRLVKVDSSNGDTIKSIKYFGANRPNAIVGLTSNALIGATYNSQTGQTSIDSLKFGLPNKVNLFNFTGQIQRFRRTPSGNIIAVGQVMGDNGSIDGIALLFNKSGNVLESLCHGASSQESDVIYDCDELGQSFVSISSSPANFGSLVLDFPTPPFRIKSETDVKNSEEINQNKLDLITSGDILGRTIK